MSQRLKHSVLLALVLGLPAGALRGFATPVPAPQSVSAQDSLYKRLGGYDALAAVTDDFLNRLATEDWNIAVKSLGDTLNKFKVPAREQQDVVSAIAPLKGQIVGH